MSHISYKTKALVIFAGEQGEANMYYQLLTPDLGLLYASAQGIRFEKSKLRFGLQNFGVVEVMLVHGKAGWRITNAVPLCNLYYEADKASYKVVARVSNLIKKLVAGEEPHPELFAVCMESIDELLQEQKPEHVSRIETVWVLKVLYHLGYIDGNENIKPALDVSMKNASGFGGFDTLHKEAVSQINRALESSQMMF